MLPGQLTVARIHVYHGINTKGGWVHELGRQVAARGFEVRLGRYEVRHFYSYFTRPGSRDDDLISDGRGLYQVMDDGDHFIGHSNAGLVWQESIRQGAKWGKVFLFSPACTSDRFHYPETCLQECHVFHNPEDKAIWFGSLLKHLPWCDHPFGRMGRRGFVWNPAPPHYRGEWDGKDKRFTNYPVPFARFLNTDHSHYGKGEYMPPIVDTIETALREAET